jgi:hypothetical protein
MGYRLNCRRNDEELVARGDTMEATYRHSI